MATNDSPLSVAPSRGVILALGSEGGESNITGGDAAFSFAVSSIEDGAEITFETDGTLDFGSGPSAAIYLGFGAGWLYTASVGDEMGEFTTDPITGEIFEYEFAGNTGSEIRKIAEEAGFRYLTGYVQGNASGSNDGSLGFINWGIGREVAEQEPVFMSSWSRPSASTTSIGGSTQLKNFRLRNDKNFDGSSENMAYSGCFPDLANDPGNLRYPLDAAGTMSGGAPQWIGDGWQREDLEITPNNRGSSNGRLLSRTWKPNRDGLYEAFPSAFEAEDGNGNAKVYADSPSLGWQWLMVQDFINFHDGEGRIDRADMAWQVGTLARFEIADAATPELASRSHVLPVTDWVSATKVKARLWKGLADSFAGTFVHAYGHDGQFLDAVELIA